MKLAHDSFHTGIRMYLCRCAYLTQTLPTSGRYAALYLRDEHPHDRIRPQDADMAAVSFTDVSGGVSHARAVGKAPHSTLLDLHYSVDSWGGQVKGWHKRVSRFLPL
jgi:hypothetical protein